MIFPKQKAIFIHIPKTAGSSIKKAFFGRYASDHSPAKREAKIYPKEWKTHYKFSFVRNPWDRICSIYHYYKFYEQKSNKRFRESLEGVDFEKFCELLCCDKLPVEFSWLEIFNCNSDLGHQYDWISINGEIAVDYVGKFENLRKNFKELCRRFNIRVPRLSHLKNSTNTDYKSQYTQISRDLIADKFKKDIEKFSYEF